MTRARGTVRSYLRPTSRPPWSLNKYISFSASAPYLPVRTSAYSRVGVWSSAKPYDSNTCFKVLMTRFRMAIVSGKKYRKPLSVCGVVIFAFIILQITLVKTGDFWDICKTRTCKYLSIFVQLEERDSGN